MKQTKVLWFMNFVLPDVAESLGVRTTMSGGWILDFYRKLKGDPSIILYTIAFSNLSNNKQNLTLSPLYEANQRAYVFSKKNGTIIKGDYVKLNSILENIRPDVVHFHGSEYLFVGKIFELTKDYNNILTIQGLPGKVRNSFFLGLPIIDLFLNPTMVLELFKLKYYFSRIYLIEESLFPKINTFTGRTVWDYAYISRLSQKSQYFRLNYNLREEFYLSKKWNFHNRDEIKIYINSLLPSYKGMQLILPALKRLTETYKKIEFIVPRGSFNTKLSKNYEKYLMKKIHTLGLRESFTILSNISPNEVINNMLDSDLIIIPSLVENASATLCEAQFIGLPIIASFTGGMTELFPHEVGGYYFNIYDYDVLFERVVELLENKQLASNMSKVSISIAEKRHDRDLNYDQLADLYRRLKES